MVHFLTLVGICFLFAYSALFSQGFNPDVCISLIGKKKSDVISVLNSIKTNAENGERKIMDESGSLTTMAQDSVLGGYEISCNFYRWENLNKRYSTCQEIKIEILVHHDSLLTHFDRIVEQHQKFGKPKTYSRLRENYPMQEMHTPAFSREAEKLMAYWKRPYKNVAEITISVHPHKNMAGLFDITVRYTLGNGS